MRILQALTALLGGLTISIGTALILSGCGPANRALTARPADPPAIAPTTNTGYGEPNLTAADVDLEIKIKSKQCFGSAGCSIEYRVEARTDLMELKRSDASWEVIYQIAGDRNGPIVGTLTFRPDGTYEQSPFMQADTARSSTKLTIKVLEVGQL